MTKAQAVVDLEARHILPVYRRAPIVIERGEGVFLYDADGRAYLDLISGVGVAALGHAHPGLAAAVADQARTLLHCSNLFHHALQGQVAGRLATMSGLPRAFFCNSGTEAVETCLKLARRYWFTKGEPRPGFVALEHAFHGRTLGSLSATWDPHYRDPFAPLVPDVTFVSPGDPAALDAAVSTSTAAILIEAIQGEGGIRPLSPAFAGAVREASARTGALVVADEIQCGLGRTGWPFHYQALGLSPSLVAIGKALGGGIPVGAALASEAVAAAVSPGDHGSTYGGNLLACRAALFVLDQLTDGGLIDHIRRVGAHVQAGLGELARRHDVIREVRGAGLMWGLELAVDAAPVIDAARRRGVLVNRTAQVVVRMLPPFVISEREIDQGLAALDGALADVTVATRS